MKNSLKDMRSKIEHFGKRSQVNEFENFMLVEQTQNCRGDILCLIKIGKKLLRPQ